MKKFLLILNVIAVGISTTALAKYPAPAMRGEITSAIHSTGANLLTTPVTGVPNIQAQVTNVQSIPTVIINTTQKGQDKIDVTLIDDFIDDISPNARHYPPNFPNRTTEYLAGENLKYISNWLEPYASANDASFDIVLRAAKINAMARNLNLGTEYTQRAGNHMAKIVKLQPSSNEANFLYGMMISEAGGFKEGQVYLEKAAQGGYLEAEQSLAQTELLMDNKAGALTRLRSLATKHPNNTQIAQQLAIVENGGFYIWNIKDSQLSLKPIK